MYKTVLVAHPLAFDDAQKLLEHLAHERFPVTAALWYHKPDSSHWTLVIASPLVASSGPTVAYTRMHAILQDLKLSHLSLTDISLFSPTGPEFDRLRSSLGESRRFGMRPVTGAPRDIDALDDAYIYRW